MDGNLVSDLPSLLAAGERAAFHGAPAEAVGVLESAIRLATEADRPAEATAAGWLLGVALGAGGRYGGALGVLAPLVDAGEASGATAEQRLFAALAAATIASIERQLGRHSAAQDSDQRGLGLTDGTGEAGFDCRLGLAADAVGLADPQTAVAELASAEALVPAGSEEWWRQRVRLDWVRAEVALLQERAGEAAEAAEAAVERAERARAPRHIAKGLLFLGVARLQTEPAQAPTTLRRAATLAEGIGAVPLIWPARALLGALLSEQDPAAGSQSLAAARSAALTVADDLSPQLREQWLARPDVAALLEP